MAEAKLRREISGLHAVMILVGYIVGSAIFILVGPLAGLSGPGLFIAFGIAAIPAIFVCLYNTQLDRAGIILGTVCRRLSLLLLPVALPATARRGYSKERQELHCHDSRRAGRGLACFK